jgi:hypothetical protein
VTYAALNWATVRAPARLSRTLYTTIPCCTPPGRAWISVSTGTATYTFLVSVVMARGSEPIRNCITLSTTRSGYEAQQLRAYIQAVRSAGYYPAYHHGWSGYRRMVRLSTGTVLAGLTLQFPVHHLSWTTKSIMTGTGDSLIIPCYEIQRMAVIGLIVINNSMMQRDSPVDLPVNGENSL